MITVEVEGLGLLEFPDGTPEDVIDSTVKRELGLTEAQEPERGAVARAGVYTGELATDMGKSAVQGFVGDNLRFLIGAQERRNIEEEVKNPRPGVYRPTPEHIRFRMREWSKAQREMGKPIDPDEWKQEMIRVSEEERDKSIRQMKSVIERLPVPSEREDMFGKAMTGASRFLGSMAISAVSPISGTALVFTQITGMSYDEYRKAGVDPKRAWEAATINALLQTPIEQAGNLLQIGFIKHLGKTFIKGGVSTKRVVDFTEMLIKSAAAEGAEEFLQTYPEEIAHIYAANPDKPIKDVVEDVMSRFGSIAKTKGWEAFKLGAIGGAGLMGLAGTVQSPFTLGAYVDDVRFEKQLKKFAKNTDELAKGVKTAVENGLMDQEDINAIKATAPESVREVLAEKLKPAEEMLVAEEVEPEVLPVEAEEVTEEAIAEEAEIEPKAEKVAPEKVLEKILAEEEAPVVSEAPVTPKEEIVPEAKDFTPETIQIPHTEEGLTEKQKETPRMMVSKVLEDMVQEGQTETFNTFQELFDFAKQRTYEWVKDVHGWEEAKAARVLNVTPTSFKPKVTPKQVVSPPVEKAPGVKEKAIEKFKEVLGEPGVFAADWRTAKGVFEGKKSAVPGATPRQDTFFQTAFADKQIPKLERRISDLHNALYMTESFAKSEFYDKTFPIPKKGGIVAARESKQYEEDAAYKKWVDDTIKEVTDTIVKANRQRMILLGTRSTGSFGVAYQIEMRDDLEETDIAAGYSGDWVRAWNNEARQKYPYTSRLGDVAVREALQNSLDAVLEAQSLGQIKKGNIDITIGTDMRGYTIEDNGIGLDAEGIKNYFLSLFSTGKEGKRTFGNFGIAKAVTLGPHEQAKWTVETQGFYHDSKTAAKAGKVKKLPKGEERQGMKLSVDAPEAIITQRAFRYIDTTEVPSNVSLTVNGKKAKYPFSPRKKFEEHERRIGDHVKANFKYYPRAPEGYEKQMIIRLYDPIYNAKLTQSITHIWNEGFAGTVIVDIEIDTKEDGTPTVEPGQYGYPLTDSRMEFAYDGKQTADKIIEKHSVDPLSAKRVGVEFVMDAVGARGEWKGVIETTKTDKGYEEVYDAIAEVFEETGNFYGAERPDLLGDMPVTPLNLRILKRDKGVTKRPANKFLAKHMIAYEAVARLMAQPAGAKVGNVYAMLPKDVDGGTVGAEYQASTGDMGFSLLSIDETAMDNPVEYAMYLRDLVAHELAHYYQGAHNEDYSAARERVARNTSHTFPHVLKIAEAVLGETATDIRTAKAVTEVTRTKYIEQKIGIDRKQYDLMFPEEHQEGGLRNAEKELYYPQDEQGKEQFWLFGRRGSDRELEQFGKTGDIGVRGRHKFPTTPAPTAVGEGIVPSEKEPAKLIEAATGIGEQVRLTNDPEIGGSTFSGDHKNLANTSNYAVSAFTDLTKTIKGRVTTEQLTDFWAKNKKHLDKYPTLSVGTWYDTKADETYLDLVVTIPKKGNADLARALGKKYNQKAIFDLSKMDEIETGGTGEVQEGLPDIGTRLDFIQGLLDRNQPSVVRGAVELTHYSMMKNLELLHPKFFGTAHAGAERRRKSADPKNWVDRTYFGIDVGKPGGYVKEKELGPHVYTTSTPLAELYDYVLDPDNLVTKAIADKSANTVNLYEKLIKEAGYTGYWVDHPQQGLVAATFKPTKVKGVNKTQALAIGRMSSKQIGEMKALAKTIKGMLIRKNAPQEVLDRIKINIVPWVDIDPEAARESLEAWAKEGYDVSEPTLLQIPGATTFLENGHALIQLSMYHKDFSALMETAYHEYYEIAREWLLPTSDIKILERHFKTKESEAMAFARIAKDERDLADIPGPVRRVLLRMKRYLQMVKSYLKGRGFNRPEDVFGKILVGYYTPRIKGRGQMMRLTVEAGEIVSTGLEGMHVMKDPAREKQWAEAAEYKGPGFWERAKDTARILKNKVTREFEHLPKTGEFAELRSSLLRLAKQKGVVTPKAMMDIEDITADLNPVDYHNFTRHIVFQDFLEEVQLRKSKGEVATLPGDMTEEELLEEMKAIKPLITPEIKAALKKREAKWDELKGKYITAMKAIGINVEERLKREHYFRHLVLDYIESAGVYGTGERLKAPAYRSHLKTRTGATNMIMVNYAKVEHEVMAQLLYDVELANTIKSIDQNYNEIGQFKQQAADINFKNVMVILNDLAAQMPVEEGKKPITGESLYAQLGRKTAIGFDNLGMLAASNDLSVGPEGEWAALVDALAQNWAANKEMKSEMGKDWTKEDRIPMPEKYANQLLSYSNWILKTKGARGKGAAATIFKGIAEKRQAVADMLGPQYATWKKLVKDHPDYTEWQPDRGNIFFNVHTIPEQIAEDLMTGALESANIGKTQIKRMLAMGGRKKSLVVKNEIADTLNKLQPTEGTGWNANKKIIKAWKQWQLLMPRRLIKYNLRNLTGDADAMFAGNARSFRKVPQATKELMHVYMMRSPAYRKLSTDQKAKFEKWFGKPGPVSTEMQDWMDRGGYQTLLQAQEMDEVSDILKFGEGFFTASKGLSFKDAPLKTFKAYWRVVRRATDTREAILRYANYLDYMESMNKHPEGRPHNFGASIPEEIMGMQDIRDRAFFLSNDLLGAYDRIGAFGQNLRRHWIPFWSWKEVNFRRYKQIIKNAYHDKGIWQGMGKTITKGVAIRTPFLAVKGASVMLSLFWFQILMGYWNSTFGDEEDDLPEDVRKRPHMLFPSLDALARGEWSSKNNDGKVQYFSRVGAIADLLEWFSLDTSKADLQDILEGKMTVAEKVEEIWQAPINVIVQGGNPFLKVGVELISRQAMFPDVFKPRVIRDGMLHTMRSIGLENEYIAVMDTFVRPMPSKGYMSTLKKIVVYESDEFESAYYDTFANKRRFMKKIGKYGEGFWLTPKGTALYNARTALRFNDEDAMFYYMKKYFELGGTKKGLMKSLQNLHPLSGIAKKDRPAFIASLTPGDLDKLVKAMVFYVQLRTGINAVEVWKTIDRDRESSSTKPKPPSKAIGKLGEIATIKPLTKKKAKGGK